MRNNTWTLSLYFLLVLLLSGCDSVPDLVQLFPDQIGSLRLEKMLSGEQAIAEVDKLHGKSIAAEDAVIASYGGGGTATVWISRASSRAEAREQGAIMVEKMVRTPGSPFSGYERSLNKGVEVHRFVGMGQAHLVFVRSDLVYWISSDSTSEIEVLRAFLGQG